MCVSVCDTTKNVTSEQSDSLTLASYIQKWIFSDTAHCDLS